MNQFASSSFVRNLKDSLIKTYFDVRINSQESPLNVRFRSSPYRILFILGHMRSASSLLLHILNSNPAILGYGETHIVYESEQNFKQLLFKVYWKSRHYQMNHQYALDKLLHDEKLVDENILKSPEIYSIFLIRNPAETLNSILTIKPHWNQKKTLDYYINRLSTLEKYGSIINNKNQSLFLTHEQIINESSSVFQALKAFLQTAQGFSEEYQVLQTTGFKGVGDSSENIKSGRIIRQKKANSLRQPFSTELLNQAEKSYDHCFDILCQICRTIYD